MWGKRTGKEPESWMAKIARQRIVVELKSFGGVGNGKDVARSSENLQSRLAPCDKAC